MKTITATFFVVVTCFIPFARAEVVWHDNNGPWVAIHPIQFAFAYEPEGSQPQAIFLAQYDGFGRAHLARSTSDGEVWEMLEDIPNAFTVAVDPHDPTLVYSAHGDQFGQMLVKKSTDGGQTWVQVGAGLPNMNITTISVSPHDGNFLLLGARASDQYSLWESRDGGLSWFLNVGFQNVHITITSIVFHPTNGDIIYVTGTGGGENENGVWKSITGGQSWQRRVSGMTNTRTTGIGMNPVYPDTLFVCVDGVGGTGSHIYRSMDGGDEWQLKFENLGPVYFSGITVTSDGDRILASGQSQKDGYPFSFSFGIAASDDNGET
jgi:hypothetical protein